MSGGCVERKRLEVAWCNFYSVFFYVFFNMSVLAWWILKRKMKNTSNTRCTLCKLESNEATIPSMDTLTLS